MIYDMITRTSRRPSTCDQHRPDTRQRQADDRQIGNAKTHPGRGGRRCRGGLRCGLRGRLS